MKTITIVKANSHGSLAFYINSELGKSLGISTGDKINFIKDENNYLSFYVCNPLESEKGFHVGSYTSERTDFKVIITNVTPKFYFGVLGTKYECSEGPIYDESTGKEIYELTEIKKNE